MEFDYKVEQFTITKEQMNIRIKKYDFNLYCLDENGKKP